MYLHHFGLTDFPFSITAESNELYLSQQHREATAHLFYSLQHPGGIIVLTGEVGAGKTTVARNFLTNHNEQTKTAFIVNPRISTSELICSICQDLGLKIPPSRKSIKTAIDLLHSFLLDSYNKKKRVVILIDEAQHLTFDALEQLRLLTNLETKSNKLVQIILVGQEELRTIMLNPVLRQFRQRIVGNYHLKPLDLQQTGEYISHRLLQANGSPNLIPASLYRMIYAQSKGVPRLINLICDRALMGAYANNLSHANRELLKTAITEMQVMPESNTKAQVASKQDSGLLQDRDNHSNSAINPLIDARWSEANRDKAKLSQLSKSCRNWIAVLLSKLRVPIIPLTLYFLMVAGAAFFAGWYLNQSDFTIRKQQANKADLQLGSQQQVELAEAPIQQAPASKVVDSKPVVNQQIDVVTTTEVEPEEVTPIFPDIARGVEPITVSQAITSFQTQEANKIDVESGAGSSEIKSIRPPPIDIASLRELPESGSIYAEYSELLQLWGITDKALDPTAVPCHTIAVYQLTCAHITADLQLVRTIDLPVVFELNNKDMPESAGKKLLLIGINNNHALLWSNQHTYRIATSQLASEWQGTGHYFIRAPKDFRTAFRPNSTSESVGWLIQALSEVDPKYSLDQSIASYNDDLVHSIKVFQQQQGLEPDGIAGFRTVALLNQLLFAPPVLTTTFD